jgi:hypothetical protein
MPSLVASLMTPATSCSTTPFSAVRSRRIRSSHRPLSLQGTKCSSPRSSPWLSVDIATTVQPSSGDPQRPRAMEKPRSTVPSRHWSALILMSSRVWSSRSARRWHVTVSPARVQRAIAWRTPPALISVLGCVNMRTVTLRAAVSALAWARVGEGGWKLSCSPHTSRTSCVTCALPRWLAYQGTVDDLDRIITINQVEGMVDDLPQGRYWTPRPRADRAPRVPVASTEETSPAPARESCGRRTPAGRRRSTAAAWIACGRCTPRQSPLTGCESNSVQSPSAHHRRIIGDDDSDHDAGATLPLLWLSPDNLGITSTRRATNS